ncbi:hypothetical protein [Bacillus sp. JCM 19034]
MLSGTWTKPAVEEGTYKVLVYARKDGKEDTIEEMITIGDVLRPRR